MQHLMTTPDAHDQNLATDQSQPGLRQELSDHKFIEWSRSTFEDSYDVIQLARHIRESGKPSLTGLDIGGGIGLFAASVADICPDQDVQITVVDPGLEASRQRIENPSVNFELASFDNYTTEQKFDFVSFRLVLHHLIGQNEADTLQVQAKALAKARDMLKDDGFLLIVENFYEPMVGTDFTSRLIYEVASSKTIETVTRRLGANTAGEGVRFHSPETWQQFYDEAGVEVVSEEIHPWWGVDMPIWQKLPLLCRHRFQAAQILKRKS